MSKIKSITFTPEDDGYEVETIKAMSVDEAGAVMDVLQADPVAFFANDFDAPEAEEEEKPKRRRGGKAKEADAKEAEPEEKPKRSRRSGKAKADAEKDKGITNRDLTKAAAASAEIITSEVVTQILEEDFKVDDVADIPQASRQKFLDALEAEENAPDPDAD